MELDVDEYANEITQNTQPTQGGLSASLYNILLSKYVQIPLLATSIAMQGSAAQITNVIAKMGIATASPLLLEIGVALALSAVCYGIGQAAVYGLKSAYNAISPRIYSMFGKSQVVDQQADDLNPELKKKAEAVLETVSDAANDDKNKNDDGIKLDEPSNVVSISTKAKSKDSPAPRFSPRVSEGNELPCAKEPEAKSCCCPKKK